MLDVGSNAVFYSLTAAKFGHKALQFDLQPECHKILRNSAITNGFQDRVGLFIGGVSDVSTNISIPDLGCDGSFPQSAHETHRFNTFKTNMPLHPLTHYNDQDQDIMLMKVDTEGNEKRVLAGAMEFFRKKKIRNATVEVTPGHNFWINAGITKQEVCDVFAEILSYGYSMVSLATGENFPSFSTQKDALEYMNTTVHGQFDVWLSLNDTSSMAGVHPANASELIE
jgi:FkbM family methyltransferase